MKIAISAESTIDLTKDLLEKYDIKTLPFTVQLGNDVAYDGEVNADDIIKFVNENKILPKTAAVNEFQFTERFAELLKEHDAVVHFSLSSELSTTYSNAVRASKEFKNVFVVDTKSLSTGIALLAIYACELKEKGMSAQEIFNACQKRVPYVQASFELKRLDYLHKGGRCSSLALFGANLLKIRPQIIVKDGKMIAGKKYRGNFAHVVKNYCQDILAEYDTPDLSKVFITYTTADSEIVSNVKTLLNDYGFKNIFETRAGATVTSHCGEDCLGILYFNDGNQ